MTPEPTPGADPGELPPALARLHRIGGDTLVRKMVATFLDFAPIKVGEVTAGLAAGDLDATADAAHALKSSAGNVGSDPLFEAALATERAARGGDWEGAQAHARALVAAFEAVAAALTALAAAREPAGPSPAGIPAAAPPATEPEAES